MGAGYPVRCRSCGQDIVAGDAHVILGAPGADHTLYCSGCCPADHSRPGHLMAALAHEDQAAGRKKKRRRRAA